MIRIGFGVCYTITTKRNPQNPIPVIKAPTFSCEIRCVSFRGSWDARILFGLGFGHCEGLGQGLVSGSRAASSQYAI